MVAKNAARPSPAAATRFDDSTVYLSGVLDFDSVIVVDGDVAHWLNDKMPIDCIVDLSGIQYSNSAGIALLLGWMRIASHAGGSLDIRNLPQDMLALAKVGGLAELFCEQVRP